MGYTHYWYLKKGISKLSKECLDDIKIIIEKHNDIIQYEDDEKKKPIVTNKLIRFNGIGEEGHETFIFEVPPKESEHTKFKDGFLFSFCKTAQKDYDIVVCKILLILKAHLGDNMKLDSDGFSNSECGFDGIWNKAIEEVKGMKYKINCTVFSRDEGESPYFDCEIRSIEKVKLVEVIA